MANYLAIRIKGGHLNYTEVVNKYPQFKSEIDTVLKEISRDNF